MPADTSFRPWYRASLFLGSVSSSIRARGKLKQKTDWGVGTQVGFLFGFRPALGTGMGISARGDAGCNFHVQVHAGAPSRESLSSNLPETSPAWSGGRRGSKE